MGRATCRWMAAVSDGSLRIRNAHARAQQQHEYAPSQSVRSRECRAWSGVFPARSRIAGVSIRQKQLILNTGAWTNPAPAGTFGSAAGYYANYRNPRRPDENVGFGRNFRFGEGRMNLQIRAEFYNIFNRWTWPAPIGSTLPLTNTSQVVPGTFGYVDIRNGQGAIPRTGTLVGRFTF